MASYYCCSKEQAIQCLLPAAVRSGKTKHKMRKMIHLNEDADIAAAIQAKETKSPKQAAVLKRMQILKTEALYSLKNHASYAMIKNLEGEGLLVRTEEIEERSPFKGGNILPDQPLELTDEQAVSLKQVIASINKEKKDIILLMGVTGSGKTEVYMQGIAEILKKGQEAIILVPEIALTPQTTERFRARFGDKVSVLHSHLSDGERYDEWSKIYNGTVKIAVGARSALFAPFKNVGMIIVDEEHENSYKQSEMSPRYNARDVAVMRGLKENATVILGSATPAIESYHNAINGKYVMSTLNKRVDDQKMPH
ncbi:MAG: primosomal protein N', partial [Lentisphaeria bacterium]|nr:primosomal protein N' [Lentisphaeria bacterium]